MILTISLLALTVSPVSSARVAPESNAFEFRSPAGNYTATVEYEMRLTDFVPFRSFELHYADGRLLYARPGDGVTVLDISDQGVVVGAEFDGPVSGRAGLRFLDRAGRETGRAEIGFYGQREFSADGTVFAVNDGRAGVRVFSSAGQERYELVPANRFALSADGGLVALACDERLTVFRDGVEQGRVPLTSPFVRDLRFSADGTLVGYVERHHLRVYQTDRLEKLFSWQPSATDPEPVSMDLNDDGLALVGLGKAGGRNLVLLLDRSGTELWRDETVRERWNAFTPRVRFLPDRRFNHRDTETDMESSGQDIHRRFAEDRVPGRFAEDRVPGRFSIETVEDVRVFAYGGEK